MSEITKNPCVLIEDTSHRGWAFPGSCWDLANRGADGLPSREGTLPDRQIRSVLDTMPTTFRLSITRHSDGVITCEAVYTLVSGEGFYIQFADENEPLLKIVFRDGAFYLEDRKLFDAAYQRHYIKFVIDMEKRRFKLCSDKSYIGEFAVNGKADAISSVAFGFAEKDIGHAALMYSVKMYKDFYIYDFNIDLEEGALLSDYTVTTTGNAGAENLHFGNQFFDYSYILKAKKDSSVRVLRPFDKTTENVILDMKYLLRDTNGKITLSLLDGDTTALSVYDTGLALEVPGKTLRGHSFDVWQTLRAEFNFAAKTVRVKLNGKLTDVLSLDENITSVDTLSVNLETTGKDDTLAAIGEIFLFPMTEEPEDYVPEPVMPEKKGDYYVGMNICPLWRSGEHVGWDCITPFDEIRPLMGYYDEGLPETADWEIKFLAEHGVDFELYCWYASQSDMPMRSTRLCAAWYNGHFHAKYSDKCKFAILWEAANAMHPTGSEAFRKYIVPFWVDYFFTDERYMRIDNKAIMTVFGSDQLIKDFGDEAGVKAELDYLREVVKSLGYDDLIILTCSIDDPRMSACGYDGAQAYNWSKIGSNVRETESVIANHIKRGLHPIVPTVSTGFNNIAWGGSRSENMTAEGMKECLTWCRDEVLDQRPRDSWLSKLVMLSNWNEYGEGTYICPTGLNGFGYLDAVRDVFCKDTPHTDHIPTDAQKERINILHPKDRAVLARLQSQKQALQYEDAAYTLTFKDQSDLDKWEFHGFASLEIKDGKLVGHSDGYDPHMILREELPFDPDEVSHMVAKICSYKPVKQICCIEVYFSNREDKWLSIHMPPVLTVPEYIAPLESQFYTNPMWTGKLTAFRFDPIWGAGDFELESITFYKAPEHVAIFLEDKAVCLPLYATECDGECYFCFDPKNALAQVKELYYEWNKTAQTFTMFGKHTAVFTVGSDKVTVDGEITSLTKPFTLTDGMPTLPLSLYAHITGLMLTKNDGNYYLTRA